MNRMIESETLEDIESNISNLINEIAAISFDDVDSISTQSQTSLPRTPLAPNRERQTEPIPSTSTSTVNVSTSTSNFNKRFLCDVDKITSPPKKRHIEKLNLKPIRLTAFSKRLKDFLKIQSKDNFDDAIELIDKKFDKINQISQTENPMNDENIEQVNSIFSDTSVEQMFANKNDPNEKRGLFIIYRYMQHRFSKIEEKFNFDQEIKSDKNHMLKFL